MLVSLDIEVTQLKSWLREVPSWKWLIFWVSASHENLYSFKCLITGSYAIAGPDSSLKPLYFLVIAIGGIWCLEWFLNGFCNLLKLFVTVAFWLSNNWARFKKIVIVVKVSLSFNDKWEKVWIFAQDYGVWIEIRSDPHIMSELDRLKESAWGRWLWQFQTFWELLKE